MSWMQGMRNVDIPSPSQKFLQYARRNKEKWIEKLFSFLSPYGIRKTMCKRIVNMRVFKSRLNLRVTGKPLELPFDRLNEDSAISCYLAYIRHELCYYYDEICKKCKNKDYYDYSHDDVIAIWSYLCPDEYSYYNEKKNLFLFSEDRIEDDTNW